MKTVNLKLTEDEAIVLLEWISNFNDGKPCPVEPDSAETQALWDLRTALGQAVPQIDNASYDIRLGQARERMKNKDLYDAVQPES